MYLFITSDQWVSLLTPMAIAISIVVTMWRDKIIARKVEKVAKTLEIESTVTQTKLEGNREVIEKVHVLVNSKMEAQLRISAGALRELAMYTNNPKHVKLAEIAESYLVEHENTTELLKKQEAKDEKEEEILSTIVITKK